MGTALGDIVTCLLLPENKEALTEILTYHVVSGYVLSTDITDGLEADTVDTPEKLTFSTTGGVKINGDATVTAADNYCTNGVVHIINQVLVPANLKTDCIPASKTTTTTTTTTAKESTIAELAVATDDLSTLVTALSAAELVNIFNGTDEYTVFAPTNEGFAALDEKVFECLQAPVG